MIVTIILVVITSVLSFKAFNNRAFLDKLIFYPPAITYRREWYRFITCGFIHADVPHLLFNMFALYMFGAEIEKTFFLAFGKMGHLYYLAMYLLALFFCLLPTYQKNKENYYYQSLGASGAVSAVVFSYMLIYPFNYMGLLFIPVYIPAFLFGFIYVAISFYLDKKNAGRINHSAHIFGGLFGLAFTFLLFAMILKVNLLIDFVRQLQLLSLHDLVRFR